jgi:hypothetical protein
MPFKGGFYLCGLPCKRQARKNPHLLKQAGSSGSAAGSSPTTPSQPPGREQPLPDEQPPPSDRSQALPPEIERAPTKLVPQAARPVAAEQPRPAVQAAPLHNPPPQQVHEPQPKQPRPQLEPPRTATTNEVLSEPRKEVKEPVESSERRAQPAAKTCGFCKGDVDTSAPFLKLPNDTAFHRRCWTCAVCHVQLGEKFMPVRGGYYCCSLPCKAKAGREPSILEQHMRWVREVGNDKGYANALATNNDVTGFKRECADCGASFVQASIRFCPECGAEKR